MLFARQNTPSEDDLAEDVQAADEGAFLNMGSSYVEGWDEADDLAQEYVEGASNDDSADEDDGDMSLGVQAEERGGEGGGMANCGGEGSADTVGIAADMLAVVGRPPMAGAGGLAPRLQDRIVAS